MAANFAEILNKALPDSTDHSFCDSGSEQSSNSGELNEFTWGDGSRAPGSQLNPMKTGCLPIQPTTPPTSLLDGHSGHCSIPASPTYHKMRTSSGDSCRMRNQILGLGGALDDMSINDLYEGSKSRKSSGFSETQSKSRNCSGMEDSKSRNCSGNSVSQVKWVQRNSEQVSELQWNGGQQVSELQRQLGLASQVGSAKLRASLGTAVEWRTASLGTAAATRSRKDSSAPASSPPPTR